MTLDYGEDLKEARIQQRIDDAVKAALEKHNCPPAPPARECRHLLCRDKDECQYVNAAPPAREAAWEVCGYCGTMDDVHTVTCQRNAPAATAREELGSAQIAALLELAYGALSNLSTDVAQDIMEDPMGAREREPCKEKA